MWLVATLVHSTTLQNTHMIQIRMKFTKNEVGTSWGGEYCVGWRTEGHTFGKCYEVGSPLGSCSSSFRSNHPCLYSI